MRSLRLVALLAIPAQAAFGQQPSALQGPDKVLTLEEAIATAQRNNPSLHQTQNNVRNFDAQVRSAYGALLPTANTGIRTTFNQGGTQYVNGVPLPGSNGDYYQSGYSVGLNYNINASAAFAPRAAKAFRNAAEADVTSTAEFVRAQVTQNYITALQSEALAAVLDSLVQTAEGQLDLANAKMEAGAGTIIDVRTAEVALGQARVNSLTQHNTARLDKVRLFEQMGVPADPDARLTTTFASSVPRLSLDSLLSLAHRTNPDLQARQARLNAAQANVKLAKTSYYPSLRLSTGYTATAFGLADADQLALQKAASVQTSFENCMGLDSLRAGAGLSRLNCGTGVATDAQLAAARATNAPWSFTKSPYNLTASVSLPLFNGFVREQNVESNRVARDNAALDVRQRNLQLTTNVTQAYLTLETQRQTVELLTQTAAKAAEDLALMEESFKVGARTFLDVTTARANYEKAQIDRVNAVYQFQSAFAALENAVGRPLR